MKIKINKCPIPIIWLDTSIIIKMAMWKLNYSLNQIDKKRVSELYHLIYNLVRKEKLICPFGDQKEEIWYEEKTCREVATYLSLGIKFKHRGGIQDFQTQRFMKAFIDNINEVELPYEDAFYKNPIQKIKKKSPYIIMTNVGRYESIDEIKRKQNEIQKLLEKLRINVKKRNESFEERLNLEYRGCLDGILQLGINFCNKINNRIQPTLEDFMGAQFLGLPLAWWKRYGGNPPGLEGVIKFYLSETFKEIPIIEIKCKLYAKILTKNSPIESGDPMDVEMLSAVIPYTDIVITDKKMKNQVISLGLDKKYNTQVLALNDYNILIDFLEKL